MATIARRVEDLERAAEEAGKAPAPAIVMDAGDVLFVDGEELTRAEFEARYPDWRPSATFLVGNLDLEADL